MKKRNLILFVFILSLFAISPSVFANNTGQMFHTYIQPDSYFAPESIPKTVFVTERGMIYPKKDGFLSGMQYVFTYDSSDSTILSILENGYWRAHKEGTVTLTIWTNDDGRDPRLAEELRSRNISRDEYEPAIAYPPYKVTIRVLPYDFLPVYRLYNSVSKEHLYTSDANEKALLSAKKDWNYEGLAFKGNEGVQGIPIHRLYHHGIGKHLYTADANEKDVLQTRGWKYEGIVYYTRGDKPVYRLYLEGLKKHLLTTDSNEKNVLQSQGWRYEGVAW